MPKTVKLNNYPDPAKVSKETGEEEYKIVRLQEMAAKWKDTGLEPYTLKFLSMLLQEDGSLTAERRHDCAGSTCYAFGFMGHHICARGTPIVAQNAGKPFKTFCGKGAQQKFEAEYPGFSNDWEIQFAEYTVRQTNCVNEGKSANQCIQAWNPGESGRIAKVKKREPLVAAALGI